MLTLNFCFNVTDLCLTCKTRLRRYVLTCIVRRCPSDIVTTFLYENCLAYFIYCAVFGYRFSSAGLKDIFFPFLLAVEQTTTILQM